MQPSRLFKYPKDCKRFHYTLTFKAKNATSNSSIVHISHRNIAKQKKLGYQTIFRNKGIHLLHDPRKWGPGLTQKESYKPVPYCQSWCRSRLSIFAVFWKSQELGGDRLHTKPRQLHALMKGTVAIKIVISRLPIFW